MTARADRETLYRTLRALLLRAAGTMVVTRDGPGEVSLDAPWANPRKPKQPMWFGAVKLGKAYVSFHLMPLYVDPRLDAAIPAALRRRMQGKTCFNFTSVDESLFAQLERLTARCARAFARPPASLAAKPR